MEYSHITANNITNMYKIWYDLGLKKSKIYTTIVRRHFALLAKYVTCTIYHLKIIFLKYLSLIQCIPSNWKAKLKHEKRDYPDGENILHSLLKLKQTNKYVYDMFLKKDEIEISKAEQIWNNHFPVEHINWKKIYSVNISTSNVMKLRDFQYIYLNRIVPTSKFLNKCQLVSSSLCDFCNTGIETMHHLFWECIHVQFFWTKFRDFFQANGLDISIPEIKITFGIQSFAKINANLTNFLIFTAK